MGYEEVNSFPWIIRPQLVTGYEKAFGESKEVLLFQEELEGIGQELTEGEMIQQLLTDMNETGKPKMIVLSTTEVLVAYAVLTLESNMALLEKEESMYTI